MSVTTDLCRVCSKRVYKAEEVVALDSVFHKECFQCGLSKGDGCNRTLDLSNYCSKDKCIYCNVCFDRLAKFTTAGVAAISAVEIESLPQEEEIVPQISIANRSSTFQSNNNSSNNSDICEMCKKRVYKAEEIVCLGKSFHKVCFVCGLNSGNGCRRKLDLTSFHSKGPVVYCFGCVDRVTRLEVAGVGNADNVLKNPVREAVNENINGQSEEAYNGMERMSIKDRMAAFKSKAPASVNNCHICAKAVYDVEKVVALKNIYHKSCFTCGGTTGNGCSRKLDLSNFEARAGIAYCFSCCDKVTSSCKRIHCSRA